MTNFFLEAAKRLQDAQIPYTLDEPMARHTTFMVGGPAALFIEPATDSQAALAQAICRQNGLRLFVLGRGSNLLVRDEGLACAVLHLGESYTGITRLDDCRLEVKSGTKLAHLCKQSAAMGLSGLEFGYGIPGNLGGCVYMNAGAYGGEMQDVVQSVTFLDESGTMRTEEQKTVYKEQDAAYNQALLQAQFEQWNNKCITEPYEPGSVFKIVTLSAGLETGAVGLNSHFFCPGFHVVNGVRKSCWKPQGHGGQDLPAAVRNSCNPAFMMIGSAVGAEQFYNYFESFGLTGATGIALPGEATGVYHSKKALMNPLDYENSLTSCSFGQTFKVTPIQMITAIAAACNGGYLYEPMLVKQIVDRQGNIVSQEQPKLRRQVISEVPVFPPMR